MRMRRDVARHHVKTRANQQRMIPRVVEVSFRDPMYSLPYLTSQSHITCSTHVPVHFRRSASYNSSQRLIKLPLSGRSGLLESTGSHATSLLVKHMKTIERVATIRILVVDDSAVLRDA